MFRLNFQRLIRGFKKVGVTDVSVTPYPINHFPTLYVVG